MALNLQKADRVVDWPQLLEYYFTDTSAVKAEMFRSTSKTAHDKAALLQHGDRLALCCISFQIWALIRQLSHYGNVTFSFM